MERGPLRDDDDVVGGRAALGGEGEAWGKSKLPVVKGKVAGGGDGDGGGLGMAGDVGAAEHERGERARSGVENRGWYRARCGRRCIYVSSSIDDVGVGDQNALLHMDADTMDAACLVSATGEQGTGDGRADRQGEGCPLTHAVADAVHHQRPRPRPSPVASGQWPVAGWGLRST